MDRRDLDMGIARQLKDITNDVGAFVAGMLSNGLTREDQITFALRLVRLAEQIKVRVDATASLVIEGDVLDDGDNRGSALRSVADERAGPSPPRGR